MFEHPHHAIQPDPVGDEVGGVPGDDDALAKLPVDEPGQRGDDGGVGVGGWNDFDETEIAGRIEEVRAGPVTPERLAAALGDGADRDAGGVRADDGVCPAVGLDPCEQRLLRIEPFDDRLDDPVAVGDGGEVGLESAHRDERPRLAREKRVRFQGRSACQPRRRRGRVEVEQDHRHTGVGDVGGDLGTHGAGAEDRRRADGAHGRPRIGHGCVPRMKTSVTALACDIHG